MKVKIRGDDGFRHPLFLCHPYPSALLIAALVSVLSQHRGCYSHSRNTHITVSEPFLDLFHWHALCKEHRGAGVAKIVEADLLQVMLLQQLSEVLRDKVGIIELP